MSPKKQKVLFLDSNIYLNCIYQENGIDLNFLKKILKELDKNNIILIVPEVIKVEVMADLEINNKLITKSIPGAFENLRLIKKGQSGPSEQFYVKESFLNMGDELKEAGQLFLKKYKDSQNLITKILNELFEHKNSVNIILTDKLVLAGMKRSALKMPPFTRPSTAITDSDIGEPANNKKGSSKSPYLKDIDCIAYESLKDCLAKNKQWKDNPLIVCTNDVDYYENKGKNQIYKLINDETKNYCKNLKVYSDASEMFKKELNEQKPMDLLEQAKEEASGNVSLISPTKQTNQTLVKSVTDSVNFTPWSGSLMNHGFRIISRKEEFCPNCGGHIKDYLVGHIIKNERMLGSTSAWMLFNSKFKCPFCESEFNVTQ